MRKYFLITLLTLPAYLGLSQSMDSKSEKDPTNEDPLTYTHTSSYKVPEIHSSKHFRTAKVKNIILLIGDGMGTSQVYSGLVANRGALYLQNCPVNGYSITTSANGLITDSAAGATALATGKKAKNGGIGVDEKDVPQKTILEMAEEQGLSTGLIATCDITHATPASFIAHQVSRGMAEEIAADFLKTDIDCFIGGGLNRFVDREDGRNLVDELREKGYRMITSPEELELKEDDQRIAALVAEGHLPPISQGRGDFLEKATDMALELLGKNKDGFFLMIESSQIDWGGHANNTAYVTQEMLDFDRTIGKVLEFAAEDDQTLVIITADHETGGFSINGGNLETGELKGGFTTGGHTGVMVPVFAFGPQAFRLSGIQDNTDIFFDMTEALGFK
jgi:alkaline phosphatase